MKQNIKNEMIIIYKERLKHYRKLAGLKQAELAELTGVGLHYITNLERGVKLPSTRVFFRICKCLKVPACFFLQNKGDALYYTDRGMYEKIHSYDMEQLQQILKALEAIAGHTK